LNYNRKKKEIMQDIQIDWYGPDTSTFGDRLVAAREHAGMTQNQLAKRLGVKLSTLRGWENDAAEPRANRLSMLSGLLNVSLPWMLTGEGDGVTAPEDENVIPPDISDILLEIRDLKASMVSTADKLGRLEKKLRLKLKEV
jgi:transcriptional regulator with XRE-family HTH domain